MFTRLSLAISITATDAIISNVYGIVRYEPGWVKVVLNSEVNPE
jgi:hypothetical protein